MLLGARIVSAIVLCVSVSACSGAGVAPHPLVPQSFKTTTAFLAAPMIIVTRAPRITPASSFERYESPRPAWDTQTAALVTRAHQTHMTVAHAMEPLHHARRHRHDHNRGYGARL